LALSIRPREVGSVVGDQLRHTDRVEHPVGNRLSTRARIVAHRNEPAGHELRINPVVGLGLDVLEFTQEKHGLGRIEVREKSIHCIPSAVHGRLISTTASSPSAAEVAHLAPTMGSSSSSGVSESLPPPAR